MPRQSRPKSSLPRPTDAELAILRVLWQRGPSTVREVLEVLNAARPEPFAYTTVLRFLQIMNEKGLVSRDDSTPGHVFSPAVPAERTKRQMVGDLLERAFGGSMQDLVFQALGSRKVSAEELREIKRIIDDLDSQK